MRITRLFAILAALVAAAAPAGGAATDRAVPRRAPRGRRLRAGHRPVRHRCLHGFGTATTTLAFTSFAPGPGETCVTGTADLAIVLDGDGSTLQLEIAGTICRQKIDGTYEIVGGTGAFAGASGGGTVRGIAIPGVPGGVGASRRGTLMLP